MSREQKDVAEKAAEASEYNQQYYRDHKAEIAAAKKKRYEEDPEYRERILAAAKERKRLRLAERRHLKERGLLQRKPRQMTIEYQVEHQGKTYVLEMATISALAKALGREIQTVRMWEEANRIPPAMYRTKGNDRLYTLFQVAMIRHAYYEAKKKFGAQVMANRIGQSDFFDRVKQLWDDYPLGFDPDTAVK